MNYLSLSSSFGDNVRYFILVDTRLSFSCPSSLAFEYWIFYLKVPAN